jgi:hypothetical protein
MRSYTRTRISWQLHAKVPLVLHVGLQEASCRAQLLANTCEHQLDTIVLQTHIDIGCIVLISTSSLPTSRFMVSCTIFTLDVLHGGG